MSDKQMNLFLKKANLEPKIKVAASIEKEARDVLEPEGQKNVVVVDRRLEDKYMPLTKLINAAERFLACA